MCNAKVNWEQNGSGLSAPIKNKSRRLLHSHRTKQTLYLKVLLISANWEQVIIPKRSTTFVLFQAAPIIKDFFIFAKARNAWFCSSKSEADTAIEIPPQEPDCSFLVPQCNLMSEEKASLKIGWQMTWLVLGTTGYPFYLPCSLKSRFFWNFNSYKITSAGALHVGSEHAGGKKIPILPLFYFGIGIWAIEHSVFISDLKLFKLKPSTMNNIQLHLEVSSWFLHINGSVQTNTLKSAHNMLYYR